MQQAEQNKKKSSEVIDYESLEGYSLVSQHLVMSEHLNPNHHIFGGQLLAWLDQDVYIHIANEIRYRKFVTVSMNNVFFRNPAFLGDIVQTYSRIKEKRRSSVTAQGKAVAYDSEHGETRAIIECEITYVALDDNGKPYRLFEQS